MVTSKVLPDPSLGREVKEGPAQSGVDVGSEDSGRVLACTEGAQHSRNEQCAGCTTLLPTRGRWLTHL